MTSSLTCGQALVRLLEAYGVDTVFGIPGVHTLELYRGLSGSGIRHVTTRHEQGAGFMADGYARASGRPGVCFLITGPGVTNAATPIGQAYSDSVPLLVISSVNARADLGKGRGRLHEITDQRAAMAPLTAFSATALAPSDVPDLVARAFGLFATGRPRPVHIEIPIDLLAEPGSGDWRPRATGSRPVPAAALVAEAVRLLRGARRPAVLIGGGGIAAGPAARRIAETLGAAVATTTAAKGAVPESHPLSLGASLSLEPVQQLVRAADAVLVLGSELAETDFWSDSFGFSGAVIRVDVDAAKLTDQHAGAVAILADAAATAEAIAAELGDGAAPVAAPAGLAALRARLRDGLTPKQQGHLRVLEALRRVLPQSAMVFSDMAQVAYTGNVFYPAERPRQWHHPLGYGTLGYALPAAIGAKLAAPERPVVALAGDGGLMFTVQELSVAVEQRLALPVVLWNNDAYGQILDGMVERQIEPIGVTPLNPDFQVLAAAFGCARANPKDEAALEAELRAALVREAPTLIEVRERDFVG